MDENQNVDFDTEIDNVLSQEQDSLESNLTEADYFKLKERNEKAEKLLVELKKQNKELKSKIPEGEFVTKQELELEKALAKEEDLSDYRDDIIEYTKRGLTVKDAIILVKNSDKALENRKKANDMNVTAGDATSTKTSYTTDELDKLSQTDYNRVMARFDKGEVKIKRT